MLKFVKYLAALPREEMREMALAVERKAFTQTLRCARFRSAADSWPLDGPTSLN